MTYLIVGLIVFGAGFVISKVNKEFGDGLMLLGAGIIILSGAAILLHILPRT